MDLAGRFELFYRVIRRVPRGKVTTYGQVALLAGMPGYARHVGAALRVEGHGVPWQRVLGKVGRDWARIAIRDPLGAGMQRVLLEREGVEVDARGRVRLADHGWPRWSATSRRSAPTSRARSGRRTRGSSGRS